MREHSADNISQWIGRAVLCILSALVGAFANIVVAPLAPAVQDWEVQTWLWLVHDWEGLKHVPWAWIGLSVFMLWVALLGIVVLLFIGLKFLLMLSKRRRLRPGYVSRPGREPPNPYARH